MSLRRKLNEYSSYLGGLRARPAPIPYTTWRRWLVQGKITEEQLLEMGINPGRKRKRKRHAINELRSDCSSPPLSSLDSSLSEPTAETSCTLMNSVSTATSTEGFMGTSNSDEDSDSDNEIRTSGDVEQTLCDHLSDLDLSDNSDGETSESERMTSVLNSKKIGREALNQPLAPGSNFTKFEVMLMIFHLAMRHGLTDVLLEDLISYTNKLVGDENAIPGSKFLFQKLFMFGTRPNVHFFCPDCDKYLGPKSNFLLTVTCESCTWSQSASSLNDNNYFLTISIRDQLKEVLSRPHLKFVSRTSSAENVISDVFDGQIYRKLMGHSGPLSNENSLTISMSTDGSPVFKNGPNTLYPVHFHLNEIIPQQRFDVENMLLAGLWFSKKGDPNLQIFFQPIVDELLELQKCGVIWRKSNGSLVQSQVYLTCVCADSVARPKIQNFCLFAASFGCSYCMHPNTSVMVSEPLKNKKGITVTMPVDATISDSECDDPVEEQTPGEITTRVQIKRYIAGKDYPLRTDRSIRNHMKLASRSDLDNIYGAKGECVLAPLHTLNLVFGVPIDFLHCILLGITKRMAMIWFDSKNSKKPYYIGLKISSVNSRLAQITPPSNMPRPRSLSVRAFWKAKEWGSFLLYYGLPCLLGILPDVYYDHFKKLSTAIYIFSKSSIGYDEGEEAEQLLQEFVEENQKLYGEKNMVYNIHLASHLGRQVAKMGPLWAYSLYPYEGANGRLVKLVKGTRGVATQIAHKYLMTHSVSKLLRGGSYSVQDSVLEFCSKVVEYKYCQNSSKSEGISLLGKYSLVLLDGNYREAFLSCGLSFQDNYVKVFNRAIMDRVCFSSRQLGRQKVSNDSCVRLQDGSFAIIDFIIAVGDEALTEVWCAGTAINIAMDISFKMPPHVKECALDSFGSTVAFRFKSISHKCMLISLDHNNYIAEFSNTFEKS